MRAVLVQDNRQFAQMQQEWNDLLDRSAGDNFFLRHEWLHCWWEVYGGPGTELALVLVRDGDDDALVGIFPGYFKEVGTLPRVTSIRFLGSEHVTSDFLEPIAAAGREEEVYRAVFRHLWSLKERWQLLELTDVVQDGPFAAWLREYREGGEVSEADHQKICPFFPLPGDWEDYVGSRPAKARRNIRYYRSHLERNAEVATEMIEDQEALERAWPDLVRLHQGRKIQAGLTGRFVSERYDAFHRAASARALEQGGLRLFFLKADGERVAFFYSFLYRGRINVYQSGFDLAWSKYSVGAVCLGRLVQHAIEEGCSFFDFLRGEESYKYDWGVTERRLADFTLYGDSAAGRLHRLQSAAGSALKEGLKKALPERVYGAVKKAVGKG